MAKAARVASFLLTTAVAVAVPASAPSPATAQLAPAPPPAPTPPGHIDPRAADVFKRMSESLGVISSFSFDADQSAETVLRSGQKIDMTASSRVLVQRPDRLRQDLRGETADLTLYYDGHTISMLDHKTNLYATAAAPPTLDDALAFARDQLNLTPLVTELLYSNPYQMLMENIAEGTYIGKAMIEGVPCQHIAFRGRSSDTQIWVETAARALPRRYSITRTGQRGTPQASMTLKSWDVGAPFPESSFVFQPPLGGERIDFLGLLTPGAATTTTTLPPACTRVAREKGVYYRCIDTYYQAVFDGPNLAYAVVAPP